MTLQVNDEQLQMLVSACQREARPYMAALAGSENAPVHWRLLGERADIQRLESGDLKSKARFVFPVSDVERLTKLVRLNLEGWGVYATFNEFPVDTPDKKKHNVRRVRAVVAEFDLNPDGSPAVDKDGRPKAPAGWARGALAGQTSAWNPAWPLPTLQVESKNGPHLYWVFQPQINLSVDEAEAIGRAIPAVVPSDRVWDATRILRVPGFFHWKDASSPFFVKLAYVSNQTQYLPEELARVFPVQPVRPRREVIRDAAGNIGTIDPPPNPEEYARALRRAVEWLHKQAPVPHGGRDNALALLVCPRLRDEGISDQHAEMLLTWWNLHKCEGAWEQGQLWDKWVRSVGGSRQNPVGVFVQLEREGIADLPFGVTPESAAAADEPTHDQAVAALGAYFQEGAPGAYVHEDDGTAHQLAVVPLYSRHVLTLQAVERVLARHPSIFQMAGALVRVRDTNMGARLGPISAIALSTYVTDTCRFVKFKKNDEAWELEPCGMPEWVCKELLELEAHPSTRNVREYVTNPYMREDGTVVLQRGYDPTNQVLFLPKPEVAQITIGESREDALKALQMLCDLIVDFPFVSTAQRAGALAAMLTPFARRAMGSSTPMFLIEGNRPGVGKSLLFRIIGTLAGAENFASTNWVTAENDKFGGASHNNIQRINTAFIAQKTVLGFDNLSGFFGDALIDKLITAPIWDERKLGANEELSVPNRMTVLATANNLRLSGDMLRRTIVIRLVRLEEVTTKFSHDAVMQHVEANRRLYVECILTILRTYCVAGRPRLARDLDSFEGWSRWIAGALVWLGQPDVTELVDQGDGGYDEDSGTLVEREALFRCLELMTRHPEALRANGGLPVQEVTVQWVTDMLNRFRRGIPPAFGPLEGLLERKLRHQTDAFSRDQVGWAFRRHRDNVVIGADGIARVLVKHTARSKRQTTRWALVPVSDRPNIPVAAPGDAQ